MRGEKEEEEEVTVTQPLWLHPSSTRVTAGDVLSPPSPMGGWGGPSLSVAVGRKTQLKEEEELWRRARLLFLVYPPP